MTENSDNSNKTVLLLSLNNAKCFSCNKSFSEKRGPVLRLECKHACHLWCISKSIASYRNIQCGMCGFDQAAFLDSQMGFFQSISVMMGITSGRGGGGGEKEEGEEEETEKKPLSGDRNRKKEKESKNSERKRQKRMRDTYRILRETPGKRISDLCFYDITTFGDLLKAGMTLEDMRDTDWAPASALAKLFKTTPSSFCEAGITMNDLADIGYAAADLKAVGYDALEMCKQGMNADTMKKFNFSLKEWRMLGMTKTLLSSMDITSWDEFASMGWNEEHMEMFPE